MVLVLVNFITIWNLDLEIYHLALAQILSASGLYKIKSGLYL